MSVVSECKNKTKGKDDNSVKFSGTKHSKAKTVLGGLNVLDSSMPNIKRGKERENPKRKKFTPLKRVIILEREKKKELKISENNMNEFKNNFCSDVFHMNEARIDEVCDEFKSKAGITVDNKEIERSPGTIQVFENGPEFDGQTQKQLMKVLGNEEILENNSRFLFNGAKSANNCYNKSSMEINSDYVDIYQKNINLFIRDSKNKSGEINVSTSETCNFINDKDIISSKSDFEGTDSFQKKIDAAQFIMHYKDFREYCNHLLSKELNETILTLLDNLARFQDRQHQKDPVKARIRRRLIYGIKEVTKYLKLKKLRCVILAPDLEDIRTEGGLNTALTKIKQLAMEYQVSCIFANTRRRLGKVCRKPVPVSCIGIFNYEGSESSYKIAMNLLTESIKDYDELRQIIIDNITNENLHDVDLFKNERNEDLATFRLNILKSILCDTLKDSVLASKYDPNIFVWYTTKYKLK